MAFNFSQRSLERMDGVHSTLIRIAKRAIKICPVDFGIPVDGGIRDWRVQRELFYAKKSMCDGVEKVSKHQDGLALDFFAYVDGTASWDKRHLSTVAAFLLGVANYEGVNLIWGGVWQSFPDYPHVELTDES